MLFFSYFNEVQDDNEATFKLSESAPIISYHDKVQPEAAEIVAATIQEQELYIEALKRAIIKEDQSADTSLASVIPTDVLEASLWKSVSSLGSTSIYIDESSSQSRSSSSSSKLRKNLEEAEQVYADLHCLSFEVWAVTRRQAFTNSLRKNSESSLTTTSSSSSFVPSWTKATKSTAMRVIEAVVEELELRIQQEQDDEFDMISKSQSAALGAKDKLQFLLSEVSTSDEYIDHRSEIAEILVSTAAEEEDYENYL